MKMAMLAGLLLLGAAPPATDVPLGVFRTWGIHPVTPLHLRSGGLTIDVAAQPCPAKPQTEGCAFDGVNNQATITVAAPGVAPFMLSSDRQASFVRVAAVRLDRRSDRAGVVVDNQWGGSAGITAVTVIEPVPGGFRAVPLRRSDGTPVEGEVRDRPRDVSGDGIVDFVLEDAGFEFAFGCNACSPRPPHILSVIGGRVVDLSADRSTRAVFATDARRVRAICVSRRDERNGNCAAYVADAARVGSLATAWREMLAHFEPRCQWGLPKGYADPAPGGDAVEAVGPRCRMFPRALQRFLLATGYITAAQAAALPLS